jgi:hypothetical protein
MVTTLKTQIRELARRAREKDRAKTLQDVLDALEKESNGLHVRDVHLDYGLQQVIIVVKRMK